MKVLIYEPDSAGHRFHYVSLLAQALLELDVEVVLATTDVSLRSNDFGVHLAALGSKLKTMALPALGGSRLIRSIRECARIRNAVRDISADHVVFTTASQYIDALAVNRFRMRPAFPKHTTTQGVFFSHGFGYPQPSRRRRWSGNYQAFVESRLALDSIGYIDVIQLEAMQKTYPRRSDFVLIPDPAPRVSTITPTAARSELGIPTDGIYLGCTGEMSKVKGIEDLLQAFRLALPKLDSSVRLLLAGKATEELRKLIQRDYRDLLQCERLVCIDRLLTTREMEIVFPALNLVCAAHYGRPGPSGTIVRAAAASIPLLVRDLYWSRTMVNAFDLGWTSQTWNPQIFSASIVDCLKKTSDYHASPNAEFFARFHDERNYQATTTSFLRARLGLPADPRQVPWSWKKHT